MSSQFERRQDEDPWGPARDPSRDGPEPEPENGGGLMRWLFGPRSIRGGQIQVWGCSPGCLLLSLAVSILLTLLLNAILNLF